MPALNKVYAVAPIAQQKSKSCWAASAAMLLTWKNGIPVSESQAAQRAGGSFEYAFNANNGLFGSEIANLAAALNLRVEAPQNYLPAGYHDLLTAHGPLWVGTAIFSKTHVYRHVRVVRGIVGDGGFTTSRLYIVDPCGGRDYTASVQQFSTEMETIALQDLGPQGPGNLSPQLIRFP